MPLIQERLLLSLRAIRAEMRPDARIAVVGYPYLELSDDFQIDFLRVGEAIRDLGDEGDARTQAAIAAINAEVGATTTVFVDNIKSTFAGHEPDGRQEINPDGWIWEPPFSLPFAFGLDLAELYHPNTDGHAGYASALSPSLSFGAAGQGLSGDVDIVFAIDTTGSMSNDIAAVKTFAATFLDLVDDQTASHRVAVVTYRDHPEHTGIPSDYASRVEIGFTDDDAAVVNEINDITLGNGGDFLESVYSGLMEGIDLPWRAGVKKIVIQLGDAGPHDPEPVTGYTADDVVAAAFAVDPAEVYVVDVSSFGNVAPQLQAIAESTNGGVYFAPTPQEIAQALAGAVEDALAKPYAWAGGPYVAQLGQSVVLDGSGSYDSDGTIVSYEWDLDADGTYDTSSAQPTYLHTFAQAFDGVVALRVTDDEGKMSIATALAHASADGDQVADSQDNCPTESNHGQGDFDGDGIGDVCDETPGFEWPQEIVTERVSESSQQGQGNGASNNPRLSADGRYVTFHSAATNLVDGDTNSVDDVFVHDRATDTTTRVSVASDGTQPNDDSEDPALSADGRYIVFRSYASNLVAGDTNGQRDIFVHDRTTGETSRVSITSGGGQSNGFKDNPGISGDGRYVVFTSSSTNLVPGDTNGKVDVFVHDRTAGTTSRVSLASGGTQGNDASTDTFISRDGRWVAFDSAATNLVAGDTNAQRDVFLHDRDTGTTTRISVASDGSQSNGDSEDPSLSADGRYVAFDSAATNLVVGDTNLKRDIFVRDTNGGTTERVSLSDGEAQANNESRDAAISANGRWVAFMSLASNLVGGDTNGRRDVFVRDRTEGTTTRWSVANDGSQGNDHSSGPTVPSDDGQTISFVSTASDLVAGDTNNSSDVFVRGPALN